MLRYFTSVLMVAFTAMGWASNEGVDGRIVYHRAFAPSDGWVNRTEKAFRDEICLNSQWDFQPINLPVDYKQGGGIAPDMPFPTDEGWDPVKIKIPSPWNINAFANNELQGPDHRNFPSYPNHWNEVKMAWMRKRTMIPVEWTGKRIVLHFEAVAGETQVYVNGQEVGRNFDLFLPFEIDVTPYVKPGDEMVVLVGVRSQKLFEDNSTIGRRIVPAGSMFGYDMNGIWQDVYLLARPEINVSDVYIKPLVSQKMLEIDVTLQNCTSKRRSVNLLADVKEWINQAGNDINNAPEPAWDLGDKVLLSSNLSKIQIEGNSRVQKTLRIPVGDDVLKLWTPETPHLHALLLRLCAGKEEIDLKYERFGWREWTIQGDKHCLNGKPYVLRSDSWHFMGVPQMTRRYAWAWYTAIKGMNGNAVRLHAQVYPRLYHEMADEMGICILDETANWASDGGPKFDFEIFWQHSGEHLARLVQRDRNHPSVFGWSISNENRPVILHVYKRPDLMPRQRQAWQEWLQIVRDNDTTRPWISSDGEDDGDGILPVTVGHYGDLNAMKNWKNIGKPWGIGETSMAYYGTPEQIAKVNGQRAYESMKGRMEGLAVETYDLLSEQRRMGASYSTVFNMAWYALRPLPLGKRDVTSKPQLEQDGIWFDEYREGQPGIQPERIGPYCTTFNPGYDPDLPLFIPWPMYDAMRAANAGNVPAQSRWGRADTLQYRHRPVMKTQRKYENTLLISMDKDCELGRIMRTLGVSMHPMKNPAQTLILVDASSTCDDKTAQQLKKWMEQGSTLWLWNPAPQTIDYYNQTVLPLPIALEKLPRSSYLPVNKGWMQGLNNEDFYFCELQRDEASLYTLSGPLVDEGEVLLNACRTDWRTWNRQPEELKTAALIRSENESTQALPVLVKYGKVYVSTLSNFTGHDRGLNTLTQMLLNAGVSFDESTRASDMLKKAETIERDANNLLLDPAVDTSKKATK